MKTKEIDKYSGTMIQISFGLLPLLNVFLWSAGIHGSSVFASYAKVFSLLTASQIWLFIFVITLLLLPRISLPKLANHIRFTFVGMIHGTHVVATLVYPAFQQQILVIQLRWLALTAIAFAVCAALTSTISTAKAVI